MSNEILLATRKGLFSTDPGPNGSWQLREAGFMGSNVSQVLTDPRDGARYAALNHGHFGVKLHRSDDRGKTWQEITTPAFPEGELATVSTHFSGPITPSVSLIWALEPGGEDQPGRLWCGTIPGGLFRSDDRGATWQLVRPLWDHPGRKEWFGGGADLPGIHSILVDPRDSNRIVLGVSCGGVWVTSDGGETWACRAQGMRAAYMPPERALDPGIQDPHRVVLCRARPDTMWAQHHNGIFRTDNGGESWREVSAQPSSFGFAVAVHPGDPDTAWFVPGVSDEHRLPPDGRVMVTRTTDGGQTFQVLDRGLPASSAYDLTFRHALDIDRTGERLAFGTTTGSLWVSTDRGESWATVSEHLPPVYAVRFVS
ncbi:MAG: exo-alpha-sialidase [Gemmatimonadales bacterium]